MKFFQYLIGAVGISILLGSIYFAGSLFATSVNDVTLVKLVQPAGFCVLLLVALFLYCSAKDVNLYETKLPVSLWIVLGMILGVSTSFILFDNEVKYSLWLDEMIAYELGEFFGVSLPGAVVGILAWRYIEARRLK